MVKYTILLLVVFTILGSDAAKQGSRFNKTKSRENHGKIFSLFSIVQFPNSGCASSSTSYPNGTCLTTSECSSKGGSAQGGCAAGFGVCCIFTTSTTGSTISTNCTYITNPGYPSDFTTSVATQTFTIAKCSTDVCRIRLDYEDFVLTGPDNGAVATVDGQCIIDRLVFTTTAQTTESTVAAAGIAVATYGNYPYICGTNTGHHSYLDLGCTDGDTATLSFTLGDTTNNKYKIKVTQLSCNDMCVASQDGCFQYYTGVTGNIKSYNFDGNTVHLASQNYENCIRQEEGYCCIQYKADTFTLPVLADATCATAALALICTQASSCSTDFVMIPGAQNPSAANVKTANSASTENSRFCGTVMLEGGYNLASQAAPTTITTCETPFQLGFITHKTSNNGALAGLNRGFSISYTQIAC